MIHRPPLHLLRRHEGRRAQHGGRSGVRREHDVRLALGQFGDPEIEDLGVAAARNHDVVGLQVAMDDATAVRARQPLRYLRQNRRDLVAATAYPLPERFAVDELHRQKRNAVRRSRIENGHDGRMVERGRRASLPHEALHPIGRAGPGRGQDLERHPAAEDHVTSGVDLSHAAGADQFLDGETADDGSARKRALSHGPAVFTFDGPNG